MLHTAKVGRGDELDGVEVVVRGREGEVVGDWVDGVGKG